MKQAIISVFQAWAMHADAAYRRVWQAKVRRTQIDQFAADILHHRLSQSEEETVLGGEPSKTAVPRGSSLGGLVSLLNYPMNETTTPGKDRQALERVLTKVLLDGFRARLPPTYEADGAKVPSVVALAGLAGELSSRVYDKVVQEERRRELARFIPHVLQLTVWTLAAQYHLAPAGLWQKVTPTQAATAIQVVEVALRKHLTTLLQTLRPPRPDPSWCCGKAASSSPEEDEAGQASISRFMPTRGASRAIRGEGR